MWTWRVLASAAAGFVVSMAAVPARAHHDVKTNFDTATTIELKGKVSKIDWINPHVWVAIDVAGADGTTATWMLECASPAAMSRTGLDKGRLKPGTDLIAQAYPAKDGSHRADLRAVMLDGRSYTRTDTFSKDGASISFEGPPPTKSR